MRETDTQRENLSSAGIFPKWSEKPRAASGRSKEPETPSESLLQVSGAQTGVGEGASSAFQVILRELE